MKKKKPKSESLSFIRQLIKYCLQLKNLRPREEYVFNVIAKHGSYQVFIGPECTSVECKKLHVKPHSRRLEINGNMHHLFVNPKHISPTPSQEDLRSNLRGSVIMKDIVIHIVDQDGSGASIQIEDYQSGSAVQEGRKINLAGEKGEEMLEKLRTSGRLTNDTYKIVQEDILKALKSQS